MTHVCDLCGTGTDLQESPNRAITLCAACRHNLSRERCGECDKTFSQFGNGCANRNHEWLGYKP